MAVMQKEAHTHIFYGPPSCLIIWLDVVYSHFQLTSCSSICDTFLRFVFQSCVKVPPRKRPSLKKSLIGNKLNDFIACAGLQKKLPRGLLFLSDFA